MNTLVKMPVRTTVQGQEQSEVQIVMAVINNIDLTMVKAKLMDEEEGHGWSQEYTDAVEKRYRQFLCMVYLNWDGAVVPTRDIDLFWHQHILDTVAYREDCQIIFGRFLDHYPYFGMNGPADEQNLIDSFEETKKTWSTMFGEDYAADLETQMANRCHKGPSSVCHKCRSAPPPPPNSPAARQDYLYALQKQIIGVKINTCPPPSEADFFLPSMKRTQIKSETTRRLDFFYIM